jgi:cytochrome c oxidase assembly protein subunit 15
MPHNLARLTAGATLALIFTGGLVTSTGSGLAVPDWPLSFGGFFPPMVGGVLFEHGHRMVAGSVALLTLALAVWVWRREQRPGLRWMAGGAVAAVALQAGLGGVTVLLGLPAAVSVAHACLAQVFFCLALAIAVCTGRHWSAVGAPEPDNARPSLRALCLASAAAVFGQLVLGAAMRHTGAGLAIPDFPLVFGGLVPPQWSAPITIHYLHRVGAVLVTAMVLWLVGRVESRHSGQPLLLRPARLLGALLVAQVTLGGLTIWTGRAVVPTTLHVATGAALLGTLVVLALRASRLVRVTPAQRVGAGLAATEAVA